MTAREFPVVFTLSAVDKASGVFSGFAKKAQKDANAALKMGSAFSQAGKALTLGLTAPIVGLGAASYMAFSKFESGMANISTIINTSTEDIDDMGKKVLALSRNVPKATEELTGALYDIRSAGVAATDQFSVLEGSAKLATAGLGTTAEAADLVTSSINAFGLQGEKQKKVYDQIFKVTQYGKTTIAGLAQGFGGVAGTVAASRTELDEYLAAVAALTTTGAPASQAHTQLKAVISGLTRETKQSKKLFKELGGKDLPTLIQKYGGLVPVMQKISEHYKGDSSKILELVGSTEALNAVLGLSGEQGKVYKTTIDAMRTGADALDQAFDKQAKTQAARQQMVKNKLEATAISIGQKLLPVIERLTDKIVYLVDKFDGLSDTEQELVLWGAGVAAAIGPISTALGLVITTAGKAIEMVNNLKKAKALADAAEAAGGIGGGAAAAGGGAAGQAVKKVGKARGLLKKAAPWLAGGGLLAAGVGAAVGVWSEVGDALDRNKEINARNDKLEAQLKSLKEFNSNVKSISTKADAASAPVAQEPVRTEVSVRFENVPPGVKVQSTSNASGFTQNTGKAMSGG